MNLTSQRNNTMKMSLRLAIALPVTMALLFAGITALAAENAAAYFILPLFIVASVVLGGWVNSALNPAR